MGRVHSSPVCLRGVVRWFPLALPWERGLDRRQRQALQGFVLFPLALTQLATDVLADEFRPALVHPTPLRCSHLRKPGAVGAHILLPSLRAQGQLDAAMVHFSNQKSQVLLALE